VIKAIIFDFDGVIVESAGLKTEAFREIFSAYPRKIDEILRYHLINAGISRYVKFRYIYNRILKLKLPNAKEIELGKRFSRIVFKKVLKAPFVAGAREFLDRHKTHYQFFIASGTPEKELRNIASLRGLGSFFKGVYGSPKKKSNIINGIIREYEFEKNNVIYIGDAESDRIAARDAKIIFIERKASFDANRKNEPWVIKDLAGLEGVLRKISRNNGRTQLPQPNH